MAYTKTTWVNGSGQSINATNLNKIETGIFDTDAGLTTLTNTVNAGWVKVGSTTLGSDTASVEITGLSGYKYLRVLAGNLLTDAGASTSVQIRINNDSSSNYWYSPGTTATYWRLTSWIPSTTRPSFFTMDISNGGETPSFKADSMTDDLCIFGYYTDTITISSITFFLIGTYKYKTGSNFTIMGVV